MNTIPITFNEHSINRTIIGGIENHAPSALNISVVILGCEESHFKTQIFDNLRTCNFRSVISIEKDSQNFAIYEITKKYPEVKFIIPQEKTTDGELINIAMSEVSADYVLVLRENLYVPSGIILSHMAERLTKSEIYCIVPRLLDNNKKALPCSFSPSVDKSKFVINSSISGSEGGKTVYPNDFIALYNRQKFIQLGGFDYTITSPYWQNLDLAIRSWLWGEETKITSMLQFSYVEEPASYDTTINLDYIRFYLKNQLPKLKMEAAYIKNSSFFKFYSQSSCGFLEALEQFKEAKQWVFKNKYRFKMDMMTFVKNWTV